MKNRLPLLVVSMVALLLAQCTKTQTAPAPAPTPPPVHDTTVIIQEVNNSNSRSKSFEKDISTMTWTVAGNSSKGYSYLEIAAPLVLTRQALDSSTVSVFVYTSDFSPAQWAAVPYYTERQILVTAAVSEGKVTLKKQQNEGPTTQSWQNRIRVVLTPTVPAGTLQRRAQ